MEQGFTVLIVGMATVFSFLILLVVSMLLAARFFKTFAHLFPEDQPAEAPDPMAEIAVAIAAAHARSKR